MPSLFPSAERQALLDVCSGVGYHVFGVCTEEVGRGGVGRRVGRGGVGRRVVGRGEVSTGGSVKGRSVKGGSVQWESVEWELVDRSVPWQAKQQVDEKKGYLKICS